MIKLVQILIVFFAMMNATVGYGRTVVTTYVTEVQEERRSTRWTLTEWLRIKERMKMMDLWMSIFSNPKKGSTFKPEFNIIFGRSSGSYTLTKDGEDSIPNESSGSEVKAQLWLNNLVSASTKLRTLNIDFGLEGYQQKLGGAEPTFVSAVTPVASATDADLRSTFTNYYAMNFRVFGKHIQDSSLIFKGGMYQSTKDVSLGLEQDEVVKHMGAMAGVEMNLYLFRWLGMEGNYLQYGTTTSAKGSDLLRGSYYEYCGYIEISLLRFFAGKYKETWAFTEDELDVSTDDSGFIGGLKLQF